MADRILAVLGVTDDGASFFWRGERTPRGMLISAAEQEVGGPRLLFVKAPKDLPVICYADGGPSSYAWGRNMF